MYSISPNNGRVDEKKGYSALPEVSEKLSHHGQDHYPPAPVMSGGVAHHHRC